MVKLKDGFTGERALVLPRIIVDKMEEDPLTSMLHITDIGYYPKAKHHFRERKEPINQYVFIYCIDGAGSYRIGDQEYTVSANQYFILPAGVPHSYASNKSTPWTIYWIHFKGILAPFYAKDANRPMDIQPEQHSRISTRINLFEEIFNTLRRRGNSERCHPLHEREYGETSESGRDINTNRIFSVALLHVVQKANGTQSAYLL